MFIFRKNGHFYEKIGKKGEPVCIDDEIPFDIPETWEWCTLGNIISVKGGKRVPKGYKLLDEPTPYIYIRVTNMKNGTIEKNNIKYIDSKVHEQIKNYTIGKDDLYITVAGTIGKVGVVPDYFDGMNLTENANKLTDISINKSFLKYALMSDYIQSQLLDKTTQVAQPKLAIKRIISTKIAIPPLNEQKRIVNKINKLNPLINEYDANKKKLDKLNSKFPEKLKNSILQEAIQGKLVPQNPNDEPASVLLERIRDEKERLIKEKKIKRNKNESFIYKNNNHFYEKIGNNKPICIDNEISFEIPNNWAWVRLDTICKYIQRGKSPKYSEIKKYPVVAQKCNQWSGFSLEKAKFIDPKTVDSYKEERILQNKDIMWNSTGLGTLGRVGLYDESVNKYGWAVADSHVTIIRPFDEYVFQEFIYLFLASPTVQLVIESKAGGSTKQKELNLSTIKNYLIPLAPHNEQKRIINKVFKLNQILG